MYNKDDIDNEALRESRALSRLRQMTPVQGSRRHVHFSSSPTGQSARCIKPVGLRKKFEDVKL